MKIINLESPSPQKRGFIHGETLRDAIQEIAEIRLERMCNTSSFKRPKDVLALAYDHRALLKNFDQDLYTELASIAEASNCSLEQIIIVNHYTDMRDIAPRDHTDLGGCSIIYNPTSHGPLLGQTWDIHGNALPYVIAMKLRSCVVFSITGCLGMTGLNNHGVGICINNLSSIDAVIGVVWPALVRKALTHENATGACEEIMKAPNGSGRHFALADSKNFFGIETSGTKKKIVNQDPSKPYFHTNHCLDAEMRKTHIIRKDSTTLERYKHLDEKVRHEDLSTPKKVFLALAQVSMAAPQRGAPSHKTATCGTVVLDLAKKTMLACAGIANKELASCPSSTISLIN
jgi:isopenicillin-N N-acyltransferase-like protein